MFCGFLVLWIVLSVSGVLEVIKILVVLVFTKASTVILVSSVQKITSGLFSMVLIIALHLLILFSCCAAMRRCLFIGDLGTSPAALAMHCPDVWAIPIYADTFQMDLWLFLLTFSFILFSFLAVITDLGQPDFGAAITMPFFLNRQMMALMVSAEVSYRRAMFAGVCLAFHWSTISRFISFLNVLVIESGVCSSFQSEISATKEAYSHLWPLLNCQYVADVTFVPRTFTFLTLKGLFSWLVGLMVMRLCLFTSKTWVPMLKSELIRSIVSNLNSVIKCTLSFLWAIL